MQPNNNVLRYEGLSRISFVLLDAFIVSECVCALCNHSSERKVERKTENNANKSSILCVCAVCAADVNLFFEYYVYSQTIITTS